MNEGPKEDQWHVRLVATLLCAASLMSAALWNGYPIVYSDTASYIISGFHLETLIDRPITYGLFIRACSFNGCSLWPVALAQSMILAHVMGLSLKSIGIDRAFLRAVIIVPTALFTGLPFVCGQIITDTFTPILLFTLYLLLFPKSVSKRTHITLLALFLLAFAMHMSHITITAAILLLAVVLRHPMKQRGLPVAPWPSLGIMALLAVTGTLVMGTALAKSKHTFFAARMAEAGILQRYLEEHCGSGEYKLCARLGRIPHDANAFLWDTDTPLNVFSNRQEMEEELGRIQSGSFAEAPLLWLHLKAACSSIGHQFTRFAVGDGNGDFRAGTVLHDRIVTFFPAELDQFETARQMRPDSFHGPLTLANRGYSIAMVLSLAAVNIMTFFVGKRSTRTLVLIWFLLCGLVLNVCINAGLVMVADRFGTKTAWLLPFAAIAMAVSAFTYRRSMIASPHPSPLP